MGDQLMRKLDMLVHEAEVSRREERVNVQEDVVCMCCFSPYTDNENQIVYCDACNASVHQQCYGLNTIPSGKYYCDRCQWLKDMCATWGEESHSTEVVASKSGVSNSTSISTTPTKLLVSHP